MKPKSTILPEVSKSLGSANMIQVILRVEGKKAQICTTAEDVASAVTFAVSLMRTPEHQVEFTNIEIRNVTRGQTVASFTYYRGDWG